MPAYPYVPALAARPSLRYRRLLQRGIIVFCFLVALVIAVLLGI